MPELVSLDKIYQPSEDVVARDIQGEFFLIPVASGMGDLEDAIYTLNETGRAIWDKLDGEKSLKQVKAELISEFEAEAGEIEKDILGLAQELIKRRMLLEVS